MNERRLVDRCSSRSITKSRTLNTKILCIVCYCYRSSSMFLTNYCCSTLTKHSKRQICDSCVHQHILSKLYSCLTSSIPCPEMNCRANLNPYIICHILLKHDSQQLLDDYLREQQWQGKSEEWIKRFATRCPGCQVPIEKNGGCDEMLCIHCQTYFYWSKARRLLDSKAISIQQTNFFFRRRCCFLLSSLIFVLILLTFTFSK